MHLPRIRKRDIAKVASTCWEKAKEAVAFVYEHREKVSEIAALIASIRSIFKPGSSRRRKR
jgi:hypothetical protein